MSAPTATPMSARETAPTCWFHIAAFLLRFPDGLSENTSRIDAFERRVCRRKLLDARLRRRGPSPAMSCGSHCFLGGGSEGRRRPPPSVLGACRRNGLARAMRRVQLQGGARGPHARRTPCTLSVRPRAPTPPTLGGGLRPPSDTSPQDSLRRQSRRSEVEHCHAA